MSEPNARSFWLGLETEMRRTATALAVAQADYEKAYTAMYDYMNQNAEVARSACWCSRPT
ncbi:MAG: hypothetical protein WDO12_02515, partial [Pseudomonadota bacterium]